MQKGVILTWLTAIALGVVLGGCGSIMKSLVGRYNVDSVALATECLTDSALVVVMKSQEHQSEVNQSQGMLLQALYLDDLGRHDEARALYPTVIKRSPFLRTDRDVEKELKKAERDLHKMRKREGYDPECKQ